MNERFRSALLGTALGDAWGYPYQESPQPECTPLPEILTISDDTQMTLALSTAMRTIVSSNLGREDGMRIIGEQFLEYHADPEYDRSPGAATTESLDRLEDLGTAHWEDVSTHSGGAGAVMRVAASALLAPSDEGVGWSVMQAILTHDSGIARAAAAAMATLMLAPRGANLLDVAEGLAGDAHFDNDHLLTDKEKSQTLEDFNHAMISDVQGNAVPLSEIFARVREVHKFLSPRLAEGEFEDLYTHGSKLMKIFGKGYDAGSCTASALLLAQLYLDHQDQYAPHDFLHVAVSWPGNRNTRSSVTGAMIGAHLDSAEVWEESCSYEFEERYNGAIHSGVWKGFKKTPMPERETADN